MGSGAATSTATSSGTANASLNATATATSANQQQSQQQHRGVQRSISASTSNKPRRGSATGAELPAGDSCTPETASSNNSDNNEAVSPSHVGAIVAQPLPADTFVDFDAELSASKPFGGECGLKLVEKESSNGDNLEDSSTLLEAAGMEVMTHEFSLEAGSEQTAAHENVKGDFREGTLKKFLDLPSIILSGIHLKKSKHLSKRG